MKTVNKSVLILHSADQMYHLVTDVARYPEFLPWCDHSRVIAQTDLEMTAEIGIAFKRVRQSFTTRNQHVPGRAVCLQLVSGPFSRLQGKWTFTPVDSASQTACRVQLHLTYGFGNALLAAVVGPVFGRIANNMVDAFVQRADEVYGSA